MDKKLKEIMINMINEPETRPYENHDQAGPIHEHEPTLVDILAGLNQRKFFFHFQPIFELQDGIHVGSEMLIRWMRHGEILLPGRFFPVIERHNMLKALDQYVIWEVNKLEWGHVIHPDVPFRVFINVSTDSISDPAFLDPMVAAASAMKEQGLVPVVELSERARFDPAVLMDGLGRLRQHGVEIALDDFGVGYSTMARLVNLPLDILKIDRYLTATIGQSTRGEAILESILTLAGNLGLRTVVEGVESQAQAGWLNEKTSDCWVQGYFFGYPAPMDISAPAEDEWNTPGQGMGR